MCVIPVPLLRWALVGVAVGLSGWFLVANVYPILATVSIFAVVAVFALTVPLGGSKGDSLAHYCARTPPPCLGSYIQSHVLQLLCD